MKKFITFIFMSMLTGQSFGQHPKKAEIIKINGIDMYYEVYGEGQPLLLLHGWTQSSAFWSEYIPAFSRHFKVYTIDLRGHGRTSQITSSFTIEKSSKDILGLLNYLRIKKAKAIGLSYGGLTLLELAKSNPEKLESMILIGASHNYSGGENNEDDTTFSYENLPISFIEELKKIHHNGESQIRALFDQNLNYKINLSDDELNAISSEALIIHGDRDKILGVDPAFELHKKLPNSELWIIPNTGHIAITGSNQKDFLRISLRFLNMNNIEKKIPIKDKRD